MTNAVVHVGLTIIGILRELTQHTNEPPIHLPSSGGLLSLARLSWRVGCRVIGCAGSWFGWSLALTGGSGLGKMIRGDSVATVTLATRR